MEIILLYQCSTHGYPSKKVGFLRFLAPGLAPAGGEIRRGGEASRTRRQIRGQVWVSYPLVNSHIAMEIHHF